MGQRKEGGTLGWIFSTDMKEEGRQKRELLEKVHMQRKDRKSGSE